MKRIQAKQNDRLELNSFVFAENVFAATAKHNELQYEDDLTALLLGEHIDMCQTLDATLLQDSWSWRNVHTARELAKQIIDVKGDILKDLLFKSIQILKNNLYSAGISRHHDAPRMAHLLKILQHFYENPEYVYALKRISRPHGNQGAERLIRETLFLPETFPLTDYHARQAALSALLTSLRQNVGSCFATAPAIMIQSDQPLQFLADIGQLLGTGRLKRTFEGEEYAVPLSLSWGLGDLLRPILLGNLGKDPWKTISYAPGILIAFEVSGLIQHRDDNKRLSAEEVIKKSSLPQKFSHPLMYITAESVIKETLLQHYKLTLEDLEHFRRSRGGGLFHAQSEKILIYDRFIKSYDAAKGGFKSITDNALLKSWEFTLASLAEAKANFARWNLYSSLGLNPEETDGIGENLKQAIQEKINVLNAEIEENQSRYDHLFAQVKSLEGRANQAASEKDLEWMRAEYQLRRNELNRVISQRDEAHEKGRALANLFPFLLGYYREKFKEFFQEVYDAEMHDVSTNPYDDSAAGFRLLYKHGRTNPALWTLIYGPNEFIESLASFFVATEIDLLQTNEAKGLEKELSELITTIVTTIKRPEFLEQSFYRLARAYQESTVTRPLENLPLVKRKPWSYISGGTMDTLVSCYYGTSKKPEEKARWVESENELFAFIIDTLKELPLSVQKNFQNSTEKSLLAHSPTHAFLIKPGWPMCRKGWENETYTYTWIRDYWLKEQRDFIRSIKLDQPKMHYLFDKILSILPAGFQPVIRKVVGSFPYDMYTKEFREHLVTSLSYERWIRETGRLQYLTDEIDSCLYNHLPLFPASVLREKIQALFNAMNEVDGIMKEKLFLQLDEAQDQLGRASMLSARELREIAKSLLILETKKTRFSIPYHQLITQAMQNNGLAFPAPYLFGDTNWVKSTFGFIVNPGSDDLELWRFDDCGSEGKPISVWKQYVNGTDPKEWGIYSTPREYGN